MIAFHENKYKLVVEYLNVFKEEKKLTRLYETSSGKFWNCSACESAGSNIETLHNAQQQMTAGGRGGEGTPYETILRGRATSDFLTHFFIDTYLNHTIVTTWGVNKDYLVGSKF